MIDKRYPIIFLSALIIEVCSTMYMRYVADRNAIGMIIFAMIGPWLGLPFIGYMIDTDTWKQRIIYATVMSFGYGVGSLFVILTT
jgi:hypothetical protein